MMLEPRPRNNKIIAAIFILTLLGGAFFYHKNNISQAPEKTSCTMDAKLCSDGSSVSRIGPACEFSECPAGADQTAFSVDDDRIEQSIADLLAEQNIILKQNRKDCRNFCVIENLDPGSTPFPVYVWARCSEFAYADGEVIEMNGVSEPLKINNYNESSTYDIEKLTFDIPGTGDAYGADIERIFPIDIQQNISRYDYFKISQKLTEYASAKLRFEFEPKVAWDIFKMAIEDCTAKQVSQSHDLSVSALLTNGQVLKSTEPRIDDVINLAQSLKTKCGEIVISTE